jgi:hypothetical protein
VVRVTNRIGCDYQDDAVRFTHRHPTVVLSVVQRRVHNSGNWSTDSTGQQKWSSLQRNHGELKGTYFGSGLKDCNFIEKGSNLRLTLAQPRTHSTHVTSITHILPQCLVSRYESGTLFVSPLEWTCAYFGDSIGDVVC